MQFVLRELSHPSAALDRIYDGIFEPTHRRLCAIWEQATGEPMPKASAPSSPFSRIIGQVVYFRIGREAVMRRMGWTTIGPSEAAAIVAVVQRTISTPCLRARRGGKP